MRCPHHYLQIEEFNDLGQAVSCTECNRTFQLSDEVAANDYYPFTYNIPGKGDRDVSFLIHHTRVRIREQ